MVWTVDFWNVDFSETSDSGLLEDRPQVTLGRMVTCTDFSPEMFLIVSNLTLKLYHTIRYEELGR